MTASSSVNVFSNLFRNGVCHQADTSLAAHCVGTPTCVNSHLSPGSPGLQVSRSPDTQIPSRAPLTQAHTPRIPDYYPRPRRGPSTPCPWPTTTDTSPIPLLAVSLSDWLWGAGQLYMMSATIKFPPLTLPRQSASDHHQMRVWHQR